MKLHSTVLALCAAAALAGCSASATRTSDTSTHKATYHLDCSGTFLNMNSCVEKANNVCSQGYDIVDKMTKEVKKPVSQSRQASAEVGKELKEMDIRCH